MLVMRPLMPAMLVRPPVVRLAANSSLAPLLAAAATVFCSRSTSLMPVALPVRSTDQPVPALATLIGTAADEAPDTVTWRTFPVEVALLNESVSARTLPVDNEDEAIVMAVC